MESLPKIKVVSWDVDGTLYDAKNFKRLLINYWLKTLWKPSTWKAIRTIIKSQKMVANIHRQGGVFQGIFDDTTRAEAKAYEAHWFSIVLKEVGLRDGIKDTLSKLKESGLQQVVVSDYDAGYKLEDLDVADYFSDVISGESLKVMKPSPKAFQHVCQRCNVKPEEILHIGDRHDTDGNAANAAGCQYFHLEPGAKLSINDILKLIL